MRRGQQCPHQLLESEMLALALELLDLGRNLLGDLAPEGAATLCNSFLKTTLLRPRGFVWAANHRTVPPDDVRFVTLWVVVHL